MLIALVDQPGLAPEAVARLLEIPPARAGSTAAAYRWPRGEAQARVIRCSSMPASRAAAADTATGDAGARVFLQARPDLVDLVDCSDLSSGEDLDTPDQLHLSLTPSGRLLPLTSTNPSQQRWVR